MVLDKLPVPGRLTNLDESRTRAYCSCSGCGTNRQELTAPAEISTKGSEQIKLSKALQTCIGVVWSGPIMFAISSVLFITLLHAL